VSLFPSELEASLHPPGARADAESLAVVAKAWGRKRSGVVRSVYLPGRASLIAGEPSDDFALTYVVEALYVGGAGFNEAEPLGHGRPAPRLAPHLWTAAGSLSPAPLGDEALRNTLVDGAGVGGVGLLPINPQTRKLLAIRHDPRDSLGRLLQMGGIDLDEVREDLGRLLVLGALRLRPSGGRGERPRRPRPPPPPPAREAAPERVVARAARSRAVSATQLEKLRVRLQRELDVIAAADDWTVVGASASMGSEAVGRACERMTRRYARLMEDDRLPGDVQDLAQAIHARVLLAVSRIQDGRPEVVEVAFGDPIQEGQRFLNEGEFVNAAKCFTLARQQTGSPIAGAWLGWAIYNDRGRPEIARRAKGRELIELAESMSEYAPDPIYLLARVEFLEGELLRAWNHLEKLMKIAPDHVDGRALLLEVRSEIHQDS
jgi:hypothetical protein